MAIALKRGFEGSDAPSKDEVRTSLTSSFVSEIVFEHHQHAWKSSELKITNKQWMKFRKGWENHIDHTLNYDHMTEYPELKNAVINVFWLAVGIPITVFFDRGQIFGQHVIRKCMIFAKCVPLIDFESVKNEVWKKWSHWLVENGWVKNDMVFKVVKNFYRFDIHNDEVYTPRGRGFATMLDEEFGNEMFLNENEEQECMDRMISCQDYAIQMILHPTEVSDDNEDDDDNLYSSSSNSDGDET